MLANGEVRAWGDNAFGQLGNGNTEVSPVPVKVEGLGEAATAVAGGGEFAIALLKDGRVKAWGANGLGQLGDGERSGEGAEEEEVEAEQERRPVEVKELSGITAIAAGKAYGLALRSNGTAMAWGFDESGQFGDGKKTDDQDSPVDLDKGLGGVAGIASGEATSYALLKSGRVIDAGLNSQGQIGNGSGLGVIDEPVEVKGLGEVTAVTAGNSFALSLGQLSSTSVTNVQPNTSVEAGGARVTISGADFTGATEVKFGATKATSFAVNSAGAITAVAPPGKGTVDVTVTGPGGTSLVSTADQFIYRPGGVFTAWGSNSFGQFCNGTTSGNTGVRTPVEVSAIGAAGPTALAGGAYFSLALTKEGAVLACGENKYGQLGDESIVNSHVAVEIKGIKNASAIAAGQYFGLALVEGKVFAWGANERGQLGDGSTSRSTVPVKVEGLSEEVVSIAAGKNFAFAVLKSGKVMAWGDNTFGELGVDNEESSDLPVEVPGLGEAATAVAGGAEFGLALLKDGKVMAWGDDGLGQLGNGERPEEESQRSPVEVKELSGITAIAAGKAYGLALRSNGTAMAWGFDESGQFGDGKKTDDQDSPVELDKGLGGVTAIAAGEATSYALLKGGTVIDAGLNAYGQTGNGSGLGIVDEPVEVKELSETTAIAGGYGFAMAVGRL